jgi:hypothetical protein
MKVNSLVQGGNNSKRVKYTENFKKNLLQNQPAHFNQTWYKTSWGEGNSKQLQKCKNWVGSFKNLLLQNHLARKAQIYVKSY